MEKAEVSATRNGTNCDMVVKGTGIEILTLWHELTECVAKTLGDESGTGKGIALYAMGELIEELKSEIPESEVS